jgi:pSer/pThr/pTyr-binding forkhead associated (FHA) protein
MAMNPINPANRPPRQQPYTQDELRQMAVGEQTLVDFQRQGPPAGGTSVGQSMAGAGGPAPDVRIQTTLWMVVGATVSSLNLNYDQLTLAVGNSQEECDVTLNDNTISKKQMVIVRIGYEWLFVDCGVKDMVSFDGIQTRQMIAPWHCRMIITMGNSFLIFTAYDQTNYPSADVLPPKRTRLHDDIASRILPEAMVFLQSERMTVDSSREPILIGSHMECDFMVQGRTVRPFHAMIYWHPEGIFVEPIGGQKIQVNNDIVSSAYKLHPDDRIRIGDDVLVFGASGDVYNRCRAMFPEEDFIFDNFCLTALGGSAPMSFIIPGYGGAITLGRSNTCDICLNDTSMSRVHAQIIPSGKSFHLIDNYNSNGTFVNNERITKARVHAGDVIELGASYVIVHYS